jgi:H+-transporting ATPase
MTPEIAAELEHLTAAGYRTLGVAYGPPGELTFIGLIAFGDPPRADSRALLAELKSLGVRTVMVSGDAAATAATVARAVGLDGPVCPPGKIPDNVGPDDFASMPASFRKTSTGLSRLFSAKATRSAYAATGPMTRRRCARRRWALRCRPRPMLPKRPRASC